MAPVRQQRPQTALIYSALSGVAAINCGYNVLSKHILSDHASTKVDPLMFSLLRDVMAFPILELGALLIDGAILPNLNDVPLICMLGLLGMFGNQYLFIYGLAGSDITATEASVLIQTQPVFTALLAVLTKQEVASRSLITGVLLTFGGSLIMAKVWELHGVASGDALHVIALLGGALCMALYYIAQKPVLHRYPPLSITAWSYLFGTLWMCLAFLLFSEQVDMQESWASVWTQSVVVALTFSVLMSSVLKYSLQSFANKWVGATTLTVWMCLVPVLTAVVGVFWPGLGETISASYFGAFPVAIGVFIVTTVRQTIAPDRFADNLPNLPHCISEPFIDESCTQVEHAMCKSITASSFAAEFRRPSCSK